MREDFVLLQTVILDLVWLCPLAKVGAPEHLLELPSEVLFGFWKKDGESENYESRLTFGLCISWELRRASVLKVGKITILIGS